MLALSRATCARYGEDPSASDRGEGSGAGAGDDSEDAQIAGGDARGGRSIRSPRSSGRAAVGLYKFNPVIDP